MKTQVTCFLIVFISSISAYAQYMPYKGVPLLENYKPQDYFNKGKIWDIHSSESGIVYMAADKGLLEFDGKTWKNFVGSTGFTRSLLVVNDSLIYTGSDVDFGIWHKNKNLAFDYTSLYPFKKDLNDIKEEFWDVHQVNDNIIFVSSQNIYIYKNQQLTKIAAPYKISASFKIQDILYIADEKYGLYEFNGMSLKQIFKNSSEVPFQISGIYKNKNGINLVTKCQVSQRC